MAHLSGRKASKANDEISTTRVLELGAPLLGFLTGTSSWVVLSGSQSGSSMNIEGSPIVVGSSSRCALRLSDPSISRRHAEVAIAERGMLLRDLGSTNGTFVGGHRVREVFIEAGTEVAFGVVRVRLDALEVREAPAPAARRDRFHDLVGGSPAMRRLYAVLERVAATDVSVVLLGETGSGKELAARAIHAGSHRRAGPFRVLDCSAVERELVSAELFGHETGAFTGATGQRAGAFEQADGGTLFIDELGELPLDLQAKLLRAVEQREVRRLGGERPIPFDCRIVAATHRDLSARVQQGAFREDLYYRLAQVVVRLPPLRERREDIPELVQSFVPRRATARFASDAMELLCRLPLRGNVRELRNLVGRACALATGDRIDSGLLEELIRETGGEVAEPPAGVPQECGDVLPPPASLGPLEMAERATILATLEATGWHRQRCAVALGISRQTLRDRMRRLGIERS